ncbi:unnamed protein product [Medioppia subpectinata]|uniref:RHD domain-containing protein n=1 Tax=Medioppia subpectinata TaxID=1979941 RepID=A0A7R9KFI3_9ACAR|nr:unnamed protein product [Medioppia subpectinata]CAG2102606.1 unnamed protein product [Medioppia subpectinata]
MSSQSHNYLMSNVAENSTECVPQICHLSSNIISINTSTIPQTISSSHDSYSCYINGLAIDITNTSDNNSDNIESSTSVLMSESSTPLILTLDVPNVSRNAVTSPMPSLILPNIQNDFSHNITQHEINAENIRQNRPQLKIVEQPTNRIRYRYRSEKGSHGGLTGENSSQNKKTYPTVKLENYNSLAQINVEKYSFNIITSMVPEFQNLGILFVGKKEVPDILYRRKLEENQTLLNNSFINANANISINNAFEKNQKEMQRI